ncbi:AAA family ATPase [Vibrio sinaloensis]|uniref:AAA family ATPase n=1 Tax=Photobacterium sp. (strain ATCC 43367) TaxID=379097 RepID=UPI0035E4E9FA
MIERLDLQYFKCFEELKLPLSQLTLLSGSNAAGKSSVIQALNLLHQTISNHEWSNRLLLNGNIVNAGTVQDVVDKVNGRRGFQIGLITEEHSFQWSFSGEREDMSVTVDFVTVDGEVSNSPEKLHFLLPDDSSSVTKDMANRLYSMTYISAERIGPRDYYLLDDLQNVPVVGSTGENTVSLLYSRQDDEVLPEMVEPTVSSKLFQQVQFRMQQFFPGCEIVVERVSVINAVTLGIRTSEDTGFHRPMHVGFGLTQILPIVVAALAAKKDDLLIIENPEVHLHPAGQSMMGQFLGTVASAGVQIIVETHSDHLLNGVRRAVKSRSLHPDKVNIHYFQPRDIEGSQVASPQIDVEGNISYWPKGFFDQYEVDMNYFAGWGE